MPRKFNLRREPFSRPDPVQTISVRQYGFMMIVHHDKKADLFSHVLYYKLSCQAVSRKPKRTGSKKRKFISRVARIIIWFSHMYVHRGVPWFVDSRDTRAYTWLYRILRTSEEYITLITLMGLDFFRHRNKNEFIGQNQREDVIVWLYWCWYSTSSTDFIVGLLIVSDYKKPKSTKQQDFSWIVLLRSRLRRSKFQVIEWIAGIPVIILTVVQGCQKRTNATRIRLTFLVPRSTSFHRNQLWKRKSSLCQLNTFFF